MKILVWAVRLVLFLVVLTFAVRNTEPVTIDWVLGLSMTIPLIVALLAAFLLGLVAALLILMPSWLKAKRNAAKANKALSKSQVKDVSSGTELMVAAGQAGHGI